ncbi:hypothetical protein BC629DRAFT_1442113 [Irpex lacteus]|nr:hypothetical protein BC629DRAFT_1442113 [Irpex lacteus]
MNFVSLFFIGVAALFNVAWHHPQSLPTVYQLTLTSVQYAVCDISTPSAQYGTVCNFLDSLRLPAAPVVLTISAPDSNRYSWAELPPPPPVDANISLVVTASKPSLSQKSLTPPDWLLDATDVVLALLWLVLMCGLTILVYGTIWYKVEGVPENIIRGLAWLFCGPPRHTTDAEVESPDCNPVTDSVARNDTAGDVPETVTSFSSGPPAPAAPTPEPLVTESHQLRTLSPGSVFAAPLGARGSGSRRLRLGRTQEPAVEHLANAQTDPVEPRRSSRGGKQVRKRQKKQELKVARRAEANAAAGPSSIPVAIPEFTADEFPPLGAGTSVQAKPIQLGMSFAAMVATAFGRPQADIKRWSVDNGDVEESREDWLRLDEEAWRKGRRKNKKD